MSELAQQKSANAWLRKCIAMRDAQIDDLVAERDAALDQRDYLVSEYERAVKCGPQGFAHAAGHLYNAISNAKCDANAERFIAIQNERDAAIEREQDKKEYVHRLCLDYQSLCEKLEMSWEREQALVAHVERLREDIYDQAETIYGEFGVRETIDGYLPDSYNESPTASLAHRDLIKQAEALVSHPYFDSEIRSSVRLDYIFYRSEPDCLYYRYHDPNVYDYEDNKSNEAADMGINVEYAGFCFSA